MIVAALDDVEITWDAGRVTVRPDVLAELQAYEDGARTGLAAVGLKLQADVERRMSAPAYDRAAFDSDDRPWRVMPGSADHVRLVFEALGAEIEMDFEDDDAELAAIVAELDVDLTEFGL